MKLIYLFVILSLFGAGCAEEQPHHISYINSSSTTQAVRDMGSSPKHNWSVNIWDNVICVDATDVPNSSECIRLKSTSNEDRLAASIVLRDRISKRETEIEKTTKNDKEAKGLIEKELNK